MIELLLWLIIGGITAAIMYKVLRRQNIPQPQYQTYHPTYHHRRRLVYDKRTGVLIEY